MAAVDLRCALTSGASSAPNPHPQRPPWGLAGLSATMAMAKRFWKKASLTSLEALSARETKADLLAKSEGKLTRYFPANQSALSSFRSKELRGRCFAPPLAIGRRSRACG